MSNGKRMDMVILTRKYDAFCLQRPSAVLELSKLLDIRIVECRSEALSTAWRRHHDVDKCPGELKNTYSCTTSQPHTSRVDEEFLGSQFPALRNYC
jgi:hypothetical protein